jgi:hypothetical protein
MNQHPIRIGKKNDAISVLIAPIIDQHSPSIIECQPWALRNLGGDSYSALALSRLIVCHFVSTTASTERPKKCSLLPQIGHGVPRKQTKDGAPLQKEKDATRKKEDDDDVYSPVNKKKRASSSM